MKTSVANRISYYMLPTIFGPERGIVRYRLNVSFPQATTRSIREKNDTNPMGRHASLDEGYCKYNKFEVG